MGKRFCAVMLVVAILSLPACHSANVSEPEAATDSNMESEISAETESSEESLNDDTTEYISKWEGEWENKGFSDHRITKIIVENGKNYLAAYYANSDEPFAMKEYSEELEETDTIKGFIRKGELGFDVAGDLILVSENELQFPYYDGSSYTFVRVGSGLESEYESKIKEPIQKQEPAIGMTAEEVENSTWGKPTKINKTTYAWGTSEQWVYSGHRYIYLKNGTVTAIQE
jgi:hypothetical protein